MLSLPDLARSADGFLLNNNSTLPQENRDETFHHERLCETQIHTFTLIPLKNGDGLTDNNQRQMSTLSGHVYPSVTTGDRQDYVQDYLQNGERLSNKAGDDLMFNTPESSITLDRLFKLNLGSQDGQKTKIIKPLDRYFASVEKDILSRQRYDKEFSSIQGAGKKTTAKSRSFYLENELSEVNDARSARTKGKHTALEFTVDPTLRDSYHGNAHHIQYGDMFRALGHRTERQHKEKSKLIHDNAIAEQKLKEANVIIERLTEKIQRRRLILNFKEESLRKLEEDIESLKRDRDEKHAECIKLFKQLNIIRNERENKIDELAKRQMKSEASYHQELQNNMELKSKLASKDRHIKALKEKVEKARKWKNDIA